MTGVSDAYKVVAVTTTTFVSLLDAILFALLPAWLAAAVERRLLPYWAGELRGETEVCPGLAMPDPRPTLHLNGLGAEGDTWTVGGVATPLTVGATCVSPPPPLPPAGRPAKWGLLFPLTSRPRYGGCTADSSGAAAGEDVWVRLTATAAALVASVPPSRRAATRVYVAVDAKDPAFDTAVGRTRLASLFGELGGSAGAADVAPPLPPAYNGSLCWLWAALARRAVADGVELFILLGDDVTFVPEWCGGDGGGGGREANGWPAPTSTGGVRNHGECDKSRGPLTAAIPMCSSEISWTWTERSASTGSLQEKKETEVTMSVADSAMSRAHETT